MLELKDKKLTYTEEQICDSDHVIRLTSDIDCKLIGSLVLSNGDIKIIEFIKIDDIYQGRLIITTDDVEYLKDNTFKLIMISGPLSEDTNHIKLQFNTYLIKKTIRLAISNEVEELRKKVASLESTISSLRSGNSLNSLNIANKNYIKRGMIPVALNDNGDFVAEYPFANHIVEINGQRATNGIVKLDSSMLEYTQGKNVEEVLTNYAEAIVALKNLITTVANNQKEIRTKLDEVSIKLEEHINGTII